MKISFFVADLSADSELGLRSTLHRIHGVNDVECDLGNGRVMVEFDAARTSMAGIYAVVASAGFRPTALPPGPPASLAGSSPSERAVVAPPLVLASKVDVAHDRFLAVRFFGSLDGLRAVSIAAVIWHHTGASLAPDGFLGQGNKGVTLFFVISGFLIVTLLLREKARRGSFSLRRFWGRRMCRILPIYYVVLALYVGLVTWLERDASVRAAFFENLPAFATFTSNWFVALDAPRVIFIFAWSLAAEEQFYLVWPWIERWVSRRMAFTLAVFALLSTQAVGFALGSLAAFSLPLKIVTSVPAGILLGVILAHTLHARRGFRVLWQFCGKKCSAPIWAGATLLALASVPILGEDLGGLVAAVMMVPLVAACVMREDNGLAGFCRLRLVAWIGTVSYGMYLLHMLSVHAAQVLLHGIGIYSPVADFGVGTIIAVGVASVSYLTLERYFLSLKERWFCDKRASVDAPPTAR